MFAGIETLLHGNEILIGALTICPSIVVDALPLPAVAPAVKTVETTPAEVAAEDGETVPSVPAKVAGVPFGTVPEADVLTLAELTVSVDVTVELPPVKTEFGLAELVSVSHGLASTLAPVTAFVVPLLPAPVAPGQ